MPGPHCSPLLPPSANRENYCLKVLYDPQLSSATIIIMTRHVFIQILYNTICVHHNFGLTSMNSRQRWHLMVYRGSAKSGLVADNFCDVVYRVLPFPRRIPLWQSSLLRLYYRDLRILLINLQNSLILQNVLRRRRRAGWFVFSSSGFDGTAYSLHGAFQASACHGMCGPRPG